MAVQLVPDSALSLLMVSAPGGGGGRQRPAPASPHHTRLWSAAAAIAADMLKITLFYPAGSLEMIS